MDGNPNSCWARDAPNTDGAPEEQWLHLDMGGAASSTPSTLSGNGHTAKTRISRSQQMALSLFLWEAIHSFPNGNGGEVQVSLLDNICTVRYVRIWS
jgi:hypothetical protein